jgi:cysteine dioxygenase
LIETINNHQTVQTINELTTALSEGERTKYGKILKSMEFHAREFTPYCSWSEGTYTRNCIIDTESFELILLCWGKGAATPIHDHGGEECWVSFLDGDFKETIYQKDKDDQLVTSKTTKVSSGEITYMIDFMGFHKLENESNSRSMSLHLYAKPIRECQVYDESSAAFITRELSYDTIQ